MKPTPVLLFRILPCIVFHCPECNNRIWIERNQPDDTVSRAYCRCGAGFRAMWGETDDKTRVEMTQGKLA